MSLTPSNGPLRSLWSASGASQASSIAFSSDWRFALMGSPHLGAGGLGVLVGSSVLMAGGSLRWRHCFVVAAHDSRAVKQHLFDAPAQALVRRNGPRHPHPGPNVGSYRRLAGSLYVRAG